VSSRLVRLGLLADGTMEVSRATTWPAARRRPHAGRVGPAVTAGHVDSKTSPAEAVFGPVPGRVLRLVTCGGAFDRSSGHYLDNLVVTAR
jgi:hypothetical protein